MRAKVEGALSTATMEHVGQMQRDMTIKVSSYLYLIALSVTK